MTLEQFVSYFRAGKHSRRPGPNGPQYRVHCTSGYHQHGNRVASLDITMGRSGAIVLNCKSLACDIEAILAGAGLVKGNLYPDDGRGVLGHREKAVWALKSQVKPISEEAWVVYLYCQDIFHQRPFDEVKLRAHLATLKECSQKLGRDKEAQAVAKHVSTIINFAQQSIAKAKTPSRLLLTAAFNQAISLVRAHDAREQSRGH